MRGLTGACLPFDCWARPGLSEVCPFSRSWSLPLGLRVQERGVSPRSGSGLWLPCALVPAFRRSLLVRPQVSSSDLETVCAHVSPHVIVPASLLLCCFHFPRSAASRGHRHPESSVHHVPSEPRRPPAGGSLSEGGALCVVAGGVLVPCDLQSAFP